MSSLATSGRVDIVNISAHYLTEDIADLMIISTFITRRIKLRYGAIRDQSNKCRFSAFPEIRVDMVEVMRSAPGRLFHMEGPQTDRTATLSNMIVFVRGTSN